MMLFDTDDITLTRQFVPISTVTQKLANMQGFFFFFFFFLQGLKFLKKARAWRQLCPVLFKKSTTLEK